MKLNCKRYVCLLVLVACLAPRVLGQQGSSPSQPPVPEEAPTAPADPLTVFPHPANARWYVAGQFNTIVQGHPQFHAPYSGPNSLRPDAETKDSRVLTLYTGYQLTATTEFLLDLESSGGGGIGDALGLAGFTNLDVVRNPDLGAKPYLARLMLRQIVPLGRESVEEDRDFLHLATRLPARRLEIRAGRFSVVDFLDLNAVGSDSHLQFLNWTVDNNGAYDYAADTRGYTWGALLEYDDHRWSARFLEALMPTVANGLDIDFHLPRAHAHNLELEWRPRIAGRQSTLRLLGYSNTANMGDYREAVRLFRAGLTCNPAAAGCVPDVIATRRQGRVKYGFGGNLEQQLGGGVRAFARFGWNEGRHESFAYTEVNQTVALGADVSGEHWRRAHDRWGAAFVSNAISRDHQLYLALGGLGFLLGDGGLRYGRETIFESYYTAHLWRGVFGSLDLQHVNNPGYNRDRGPVLVPAARLHVDF